MSNNNAAVDSAKQKLDNVKQKFKKEGKETKKEEVKRDSLVTCRVLFISVLDKIYLVILLLMLIALTWINFSGDMSSIDYGFWSRVGREILILLYLVVMYFLFNWFYRCAVKTMLCLTENEVYKESYVPLKRTEKSIPLNKITGVTTYKVLWIFRAVVIHQYHRFPMWFFTWNNQEFKDKLNELITTEKKHVKNEFDDRNIIAKDKLKYVLYLLIVVAAVVVLLGLARFLSYMFSEERKVAGTYVHETSSIVLDSDGSCEIDDIVSDTVLECSWEYDKNSTSVDIDYKYAGYYYDLDSYLYLDYNADAKTLEHAGTTYTRK